MSIQIKTKEAGYVIEATYGVDPIDINSEVIKYGRFMIPFGPFPAYSTTTLPIYLPNASREANEFKVTIKRGDFGITCQLVNLLPFYLFFGLSSTTDGVHTITAQAVSIEKPSFTHRYKYESDQIDKIKHIIGCKLVSITFEFDFITLKIPQIVLLMKGIEFVDAGFPEENAPVIPGTNEIYNKVAQARWNSTNPDSGGEDIAPILANFALMCIDSNRLELPEIDTLLLQRIIDGEFAYILRLALFRGKTLTLIDYLQDFDNDTSAVNMVIKIPRSATEYITFTLTGLYPKEATKKETKTEGLEFDIYEFFVKSVSVSGKDGLDPTIYYGE